MSLIKEIVNRLRGAEEQAANQVRDPVTDAVISIEDSKKEAARFESSIAQLMAQTADFSRQVDEAGKEAQKWAGIAEQCVRQEKDEDAKKALQFQQEAEERLTTAKSELAKNQAILADERKKLDSIRAQIHEAESNLTRLKVRREGAQIRQEISRASDEFSRGGSPLAALQDLKKETDKQEDLATAYETLSQSSEQATAGDLEKKYAGGQTSVDERLAALKSKMGQGG